MAMACAALMVLSLDALASGRYLNCAGLNILNLKNVERTQMPKGNSIIARCVGKSIYIGDERTAVVALTDLELQAIWSFMDDYGGETMDDMRFAATIMARLIDSLGAVIVTAVECHSNEVLVSVKAPEDVPVRRGEIAVAMKAKKGNYILVSGDEMSRLADPIPRSPTSSGSSLCDVSAVVLLTSAAAPRSSVHLGSVSSPPGLRGNPLGRCGVDPMSRGVVGRYSSPVCPKNIPTFPFGDQC
jgi:sRNA-binding carbon storage regulator CsrA